MRRVAIFFACAGAALLLSGLAGFHPALSLATLASSDGSISAPLAERLKGSQECLGWLLLLGAPISFLARAAAPFATRLASSSENKFAATILLFAFGGTLFLQESMFDGIPHVTDATCHVFQARTFASGRLYAPLPPCPEAFHQPNMIMKRNGMWFSKYPPGHALVLAVGERFQARWAVMPALNALLVLLAYQLARRVAPPGVARAFGLLACASPMLLMLGASYMSHTTAMVFTLLAVHALLRGCDTTGGPAHRAGFAAGLCAGALLITRPPEFMVFGLTLLLVLPALGWKTCVALARLLPGALPGFAIPVALWLGMNYGVHGKFLTIGYSTHDPQLITHLYTDQYGFHPGFTLRDAARIAAWSTLRLDKALTGWPSTFLLLLLAGFGAVPRRWLYVCAVGIAANYLLYLPYNYFGLEFEARYYFPASLFLLFMTAFCARRLFELLQRPFREFAGTALVVLLLVFYGHGIAHYWTDTLWPRYGRDYEQAGTSLKKLAEASAPGKSLILISTADGHTFRYSSGFVFNDPLLQNDIIYGHDQSRFYECLQENFPGRKILRFIPDPGWQGGTLVPLSGVTAR